MFFAVKIGKLSVNYPLKVEHLGIEFDVVMSEIGVLLRLNAQELVDIEFLSQLVDVFGKLPYLVLDWQA